ncbi:MAG TPA: CDP-alcohol phosphatidyltransferase family protein [Candidatus Polarisedimenticolaceae bacterium]
MSEARIKDRVGNWTLANQLTFLRLIAVPCFILAVLNARFGIAFWLFVAAGITDLLDGLVARVFRQQSPLGAYLDPAADKLLLAAGFILLTEYPQLFQQIPMVNRIPVWLTILTISRDVFIVSVALMLYLAYGHTKFRPSFLGKCCTAAELVTVGAVLLFNDLGRSHPLIGAGVLATFALTVISGLHYIWRTVRTVRAADAGRAGA